MEEEKSFEELLEETSKKVNLEKTVTGKIIAITKKGEIFVDLGYKADGLIPKNEYSDKLEDDPKDEFKVGDKITADVLKLNDGQGNVLLSYKKVKSRNDKKAFEDKINNQEVFEEIVEEVGQKGIIVKHNNTKIFIPLSLSGLKKGEDANSLKGKKVKFKITEYKPQIRRIIGSIKIIQDEEKQEKLNQFWSTVTTAKEYEGKIESITSYGLFVSVGEIQGLLHISEISWSKSVNLQKMFKVGDTIKVAVKEFNKEENKIQFTYLEKGEDPWNKVEDKYHINDIVRAKVTNLVNFGAFLELEEGIEGLVHISQICEERITKPEEKLKIGQAVNAKIIDIVPENKKIELSIKELEGTSNEYIEEI